MRISDWSSDVCSSDLLSSRQLRGLSQIACKYDRGWGHFTTRQNIQFNWIKLEEAADALADLAKVQMHAIQTSGNTIRNTTTDQFAGAAHDEIEAPRLWCGIIRQWSRTEELRVGQGCGRKWRERGL